MKTYVSIKDHKITSDLNLEDGTYTIVINKKCDNKTLDQVKKLWATINDISVKLYGNKSESDNIYTQILHMAGVRTHMLVLDDRALADLRDYTKHIYVKERSVVNGRPMALVEVCFSGISEMTRKEVSEVIDCCIRYADEVGVEPYLEREEW